MLFTSNETNGYRYLTQRVTIRVLPEGPDLDHGLATCNTAATCEPRAKTREGSRVITTDIHLFSHGA
eukprot:scaffold24_cov186-Alexandrium_tamarense.AAC.38